MTFAMLLIGILLLHWVGDFVLQSDWMALNKSRSWTALLAHVGTYTVLMSVFLLIFFGTKGAAYALINGVAHLVVDYFSSRCTSKLFAKGDRHTFFVVIGCDQLIHQVCLIATMWILV